LTELHAEFRVYPEPAVEVAEALSTFPMTTEFSAGVMEVTDVPAWLVEEPPVEVTGASDWSFMTHLGVTPAG